MTINHLHIFVVLSIAVLSGCLGEAEHANPLDPHAPGFDSVGTLAGITTRYYAPHSPVPDAEVRLSPGTYTVQSGADGAFTFRDVPVGDYRIVAAKPGFASLEKDVMVELGAAIDTVRLRLDGLPSLETVQLYSVHISRWFPTEDLYLLTAVVVLEDPDGLGDLDRVWLEIPGRAYAHDLRETSVAGRYDVSLEADSLPGESLYALQAEEFIVKASDEAGFVSLSEPLRILRVIDYTPIAVSPQGQATIGTDTPTFTWEDAAFPYDYRYRIEVVRDQPDVQTVAAVVTDIPPDSLSHTLQMPLPTGTYFWTISVVDEFGNRSRSKEAGFVIE